jgi:hypothetical protein
LGIIAENLSKAGWSWGWISAVDSAGRTIWIVDGLIRPRKFRRVGPPPPSEEIVEVGVERHGTAVLVRLDYVASVIVNANHGPM